MLVGGCAASLYKTFIIALAGEEKPYNRAYGAGKCTPFGAAHHFPRRGKFALCPAFELISSSKHSVANTSPSGWQANVICRGSEATRKSRETLSRGGGAVGRRGAFPRAKQGCLVFAAARQHTYSSPLKGKRLTTFCASLTLLQNVFAVHREAAIPSPLNLHAHRACHYGQRPVHLKNLFIA